MQDYRNLGGAGESWRMSVESREMVSWKELTTTIIEDFGDEEEVGDTMTVQGTDRRGFRLVREIDMGEGFRDWPLGDAGIEFAQRRDAEGYGLLLAMSLRGDLLPGQLPEPASFGGVRDALTELSKTRRRIFFRGVATVDRQEGWSEIDPQGILAVLPDPGDPFHSVHDYIRLPIEEQAEIELRDLTAEERRAHSIIQFVELAGWHYFDNVLTARLRKPYLATLRDLEAELPRGFEILRQDRGYVALLVLSRLRVVGPVDWFFPGQRDELRRLIPRLRGGLPEAAEAAIERLRREPELARR